MTDSQTPDRGARRSLSRRAYLALLGVSAGSLAGCLALPDPVRSSPVSNPLPVQTPGSADVTVSGSRRLWSPVTLSFDGPETSERADPNPFLDYRLDVTFTAPSGETLLVPGYYAADGDAADTDADSGSVWRAHLSPHEVGEWRYHARFRHAPNVAVAGADGDGGADGVGEFAAAEPTAFDGASGSFEVAPAGSPTADFRTRGRLAYVGDHYLRFLGTGEYFLKTGANSPENFLAYHDFSGTHDTNGSFLHRYDAHVADWRPGDPTWLDGKGKGIVGVVNYLADRGVNAQFLMPYTVDGGDGEDVWPWTAADERYRFDVSKLDQWDRVFEHMMRRGVVVHLVLGEMENDRDLDFDLDGGRDPDDGALGVARRLYLRELVARFAHHPALLWNLAEETTTSPAHHSAYARTLRSLDPYDHPISIHTAKAAAEKERVYGALLGNPDFEGPSLQTSAPHDEVVAWRERSAAAGRPWVVGVDEVGDYRCGVPADGETCRGVSQDDLRASALWGSLLAGAAGVEWYFGYETDGGDLTLEDYRSREAWWAVNRHARTLLERLPLHEMAPDDDVLDGVPGYCFAKAGTASVCYLPHGGAPTLALTPGVYDVRWYDPRTGAFVGDVETVDADGDPVTLDAPPIEGDAVVVVTAAGSFSA